MTTPALPEALRACASGIYALEASAELLIAHAGWLDREDFTAAFIHTSRSLANPATDMAVIDWPAAMSALDTGQLPCSASEHKILRLAASLAEDHPVRLGTSVTGLDDRNIQLLVTAILHASGRRQPPSLP
jgi:hypothetical protein